MVGFCIVASTVIADMGCSHLNTLLSTLDMPPMYPTAFKVHEVEVGGAAEDMAEASCKAAALKERILTIEHIEELKKLL